jgi:hypothetical protein
MMEQFGYHGYHGNGLLKNRLQKIHGNQAIQDKQKTIQDTVGGIPTFIQDGGSEWLFPG